MLDDCFRSAFPLRNSQTFPAHLVAVHKTHRTQIHKPAFQWNVGTLILQSSACRYGTTSWTIPPRSRFSHLETSLKTNTSSDRTIYASTHQSCKQSPAAIFLFRPQTTNIPVSDNKLCSYLRLTHSSDLGPSIRRSIGRWRRR